MRRTVVPYLVLAVLLGALGGIAWLTHHPETPWLEKAQTWPVVGPLAARFRRAYVQPRRVERAQQESQPSEVIVIRRLREQAPSRPAPARRRPAATGAVPTEPKPAEMEEPLRFPSLAEGASLVPPVATVPEPMAAERRPPLEIPPRPVAVSGLAEAAGQAEPLEYRWLLPGAELFAEPEEGTAAIERLSRLAYLPVVERQGEWLKVMHRRRPRWFPGAGDGQPAPTRRDKPRRLVDVSPPDWAKLRLARKLLGLDDPVGMVGSYRLFTDLEDPDLLAFLDTTAQQAEAAYLARYGRAPAGRPRHAVVLFSRAEDYRTFSAEMKGPPGTRHWGHAGSGVVAMLAGDRPRRWLAGSLLHEITHLLNDRALAPQLPPWLEEGLASDLGDFWMEDAASAPMESPGDFSLSVVLAADRTGSLPSVSQLLLLPYERFHDSAAAGLNYAYSLLLVRFFLDGEGGRLAPKFRGFLAAVARGRDPSPAELLRQLGMSPEQLEAEIHAFLQARRIELASRPH